MSAAQRILDMPLHRIVQFDRRLDAALGHDRVAVAEAQFGGQQDARAFFGRCQRRCATRAAAADHQHVDISHRCAGQIGFIDERLGLQESGQFALAAVAGIGSHRQLDHASAQVVRVIGVEQRVRIGQLGQRPEIRIGPVAREGFCQRNAVAHF